MVETFSSRKRGEYSLIRYTSYGVEVNGIEYSTIEEALEAIRDDEEPS